MISFRLGLALSAAAALTACAGKPKPALDSARPEATATAAPETSDRQGAPSVATPADQAALAAEAGDRVFFALDSNALAAEARETLARQAAWLSRNPTVAAIIAGSADERGTREYNLALGARRAAAARRFLVTQGVDATRLETISYGKEQPFDPASGEAAWARNRNAQTVLTSGR